MGVSSRGLGAAPLQRAVSRVLPAVGLVAVQLVFFGMPAGAWVRGVILGLLTALLAMGMALVYRANRVINFAQADLGFVPTSLAVGLIVFSGLPYLFGFGVGLAAAIALGAIVELAFVRRFAKASRLVLTVATIGITQLLAVLALLVPQDVGPERRLAAHSAAGRLEAHDRHVHPVGQRPDRADRRTARDGRRRRVPRHHSPRHRDPRLG